MLYNTAVAICYFSIGLLLAIPYNHLSGGDPEEFLLTALIAPLAVGYLFITFSLSRQGIIMNRRGRRLGVGFCLTAAYFALPIILNSMSIALGWIGLEAASKATFNFRYLSLPAVLLAIILVFLVSAAITPLKSNIRQK